MPSIYKRGDIRQRTPVFSKTKRAQGERGTLPVRRNKAPNRPQKEKSLAGALILRWLMMIFVLKAKYKAREPRANDLTMIALTSLSFVIDSKKR